MPSQRLTVTGLPGASTLACAGYGESPVPGLAGLFASGLGTIINLRRRERDGLHEARVAGLLHPLGDLLHHPVERLLLPPIAACRPVHGLRPAPRVDRELVRGRALRAERALGVRRVGIALDVDDLAVLDVDKLGAAHRAVGADTGKDLRFLDPEVGGGGFDGGEVDAPGREHVPATVADHLRKSRLDRLMAVLLSRG